ncbi:universal stress protein [Paraburkholderia hayleyella]|uniref:universal stress protein n=1 Tax=Paraburkholderia hayleyella TaxID=2152889 RepID=UPI001291ACA1|nr:universal stress protein [Paraburkholderia hayleyella]
MYTRILVAVDGSQTARRAFDAALDLARSNGARLQPFYVIENIPMYFEAPGYDPSVLRNNMIEQGKELGTQFAQAMREQDVEGELLTGEASSLDDVSTVILRAATQFGADLLVLGTHGRRGVQRLILGSIAERCVRQATLPVLLIPAAAVLANLPADEKADHPDSSAPA